MLQQRKVDPGVLPKHLARTACRSTFPGPLVDSLKLCSVHVASYIASCAWSRRVQPCSMQYRRGVVSIWSMFVFLTMLTLYPDGRITGFALDTKTSGAAKVY